MKRRKRAPPMKKKRTKIHLAKKRRNMHLLLVAGKKIKIVKKFKIN